MKGIRRGLAATLGALSLTAVLPVPIATLDLSLADQWSAISERVTALLAGGMGQPRGRLGEIPLGRSASAYWQSTTADPSHLNQDLTPTISAIRKFIALREDKDGREVRRETA